MLRVGLVSKASVFDVSDKALAWKFVLHGDDACRSAHVYLCITVTDRQEEMF